MTIDNVPKKPSPSGYMNPTSTLSSFIVKDVSYSGGSPLLLSSSFISCHTIALTLT